MEMQPGNDEHGIQPLLGTRQQHWKMLTVFLHKTVTVKFTVANYT